MLLIFHKNGEGEGGRGAPDPKHPNDPNMEVAKTRDVPNTMDGIFEASDSKNPNDPKMVGSRTS